MHHRNNIHNWRKKIGIHNVIIEDKSGKIFNPPEVKNKPQVIARTIIYEPPQIESLAIPRWAIPLMICLLAQIQLSGSMAAAEATFPKPKEPSTKSKKDVAKKPFPSSHKSIQSSLSVTPPKTKTSICESGKPSESGTCSKKLPDAITIRIVYEHSDYKKTKFSQKKYLEQYQEFQKRLYQRVLPYVASKEILKKADVSKDFYIVVRPTAVVQGAQYMTNTNQIWLELCPHYSDNALINMLRNEFFHQSICTTDKIDACLQDNDSVKLRLIADNGYKKIINYQKIIANQEKNKDKPLPTELQELVAAAENYLPFNYVDEMSLDKHHNEFLRSEGFKQLTNGQVLMPAGNYILHGIKTTVDLYATFTQTDENTMMHAYYTTVKGDQSPLSNAKAFIHDVIFRRTHDYQAGSYAENSEKIKTENLGSDIAQLPKKLINLVYEGYCELMGNVTDVANYCHKYSPRP